MQLTKTAWRISATAEAAAWAATQQQEQNDTQQGENQDNTRQRVSAGNVAWSRDSKKFALVRRDSRKVEKLWVINSLASPRPTLDTYRYAMPGDVNVPSRNWKCSTSPPRAATF